MPEDADAEKGWISTASPIGRALLGKEEGDEVTVPTPTGVRTFEILKLDDHSRRAAYPSYRRRVHAARETPYSPRQRTALVFAGTGTAGAYHAGVLRALAEAGVKVDLVAGRGMGAVAALLCRGRRRRAALGGRPVSGWAGRGRPRLYPLAAALARLGRGLPAVAARRARAAARRAAGAGGRVPPRVPARLVAPC